jgi:hypothetical protein
MEIKFTTIPGISVRGLEQPRPVRQLEQAGDEAEFNQVKALDRALEEIPDVRTEEMLRAKDLFASVQYPPIQLIHRISRLLAKEWDQAAG